MVRKLFLWFISNWASWYFIWIFGCNKLFSASHNFLYARNMYKIPQSIVDKQLHMSECLICLSFSVFPARKKASDLFNLRDMSHYQFWGVIVPVTQNVDRCIIYNDHSIVISVPCHKISIHQFSPFHKVVLFLWSEITKSIACDLVVYTSIAN